MADLRGALNLEDNAQVADRSAGEGGVTDRVVAEPHGSHAASPATEPATAKALTEPAAANQGSVQIRTVRLRPWNEEVLLEPGAKIDIIQMVAIKETMEEILRTMPSRFSRRSEQKVKQQAAVAKEMLEDKLSKLAHFTSQVFEKHFEEQRSMQPSADIDREYRHFMCGGRRYPEQQMEAQVNALRDELERYYDKAIVTGYNHHAGFVTRANGTYDRQYDPKVTVELEGLRPFSPNRGKYRAKGSVNPMDLPTFDQQLRDARRWGGRGEGRDNSYHPEERKKVPWYLKNY